MELEMERMQFITLQVPNGLALAVVVALLAMAAVTLAFEMYRITLFIKDRRRAAKAERAARKARRAERAKKLEAAERSAKGEVLVAKARAVGRTLCSNYKGGVLGLCFATDFDKAYAEFIRDVENGDRKRTDRVVLHVKPTFTFWRNENSQRLAHTGGDEELRSLVWEIVERFTGSSTRGIDTKAVEAAFREMVVEDGRLFVPFCDATAERSEKLGYVHQPFREARERILSAKA